MGNFIINTFFPHLKEEEETEDQRIKRIKMQELEKYGEIDDIFRRYDEDGSGSLGQEEFNKAILNYIELHKDKESLLKEQMKAIDFSGDTTITLSEFRLLISSFITEEIEIGDIIEVFKLFDKNLSGQIGADEIIHVMAQLGLNLSVQEAEELIKEGDNDSDKVLDFEEFVKIMLSK
mmetsp:Transcript_17427/g.18097  ORF Transcript_17427/g.18097 Transcript_17427/m.18097 type:complete len:177 (+) Transcript_17427:29-559(+)